MKDCENGFYTIKGYHLKNHSEITDAMEDYLEMICRLSGEQSFVRTNILAEKLNVKPSSASKMVQNLKKGGYVDFEKYGLIKLTKKGWDLGNYLLYRHDVLYKFFCMLNNSESELEQVELIEHYLTRETIFNLDKLTQKIKNGL